MQTHTTHTRTRMQLTQTLDTTHTHTRTHTQNFPNFNTNFPTTKSSPPQKKQVN